MGNGFDAKKFEDSAATFLRETFGRFEDTLRKDLERSRADFLQLWKHAGVAARSVREISNEVATEMRVEVQQAAASIQSSLVSREFEAQLDELIRHAGYNPADIVQSNQSDDTWFARVHASLQEDPVEKAESAFSKESEEELKERRNRIGQKLAFLYRAYRDGFFEATKAGA